MTEQKKVLFFDVDGTLVNMEGEIPQSTIEGLRLAQNNGHKLIVCTGRSIGQLHPELKIIPFDGYICGAGAYVKYQDKVIDTHPLPQSMLKKIVDFYDKEKIIFALQAVDHTVTRKNLYSPLISTLKVHLDINDKQINSIFGKMEYDEHLELLTNVEKSIFYEASKSLEEIRNILGPEFSLVDMSFIESGSTSGEIMQTGINKAYGMKKLLSYLNKGRDDSIAFGDSSNDMEMLQYAGISVAMGNASDEIKKISHMVTEDIEKNGIYLALQKLNII